MPDAGVSQLDNLSAAGEQFSRQKRSPLSYLTAMEKSFSSMGAGGTAQRIKARGSYIIIPTVITKAPRPDLLARCATKRRLTMPMFRLPVVIDADSGAAYYYRGRAIWGGGVLSEYVFGRLAIDRAARRRAGAGDAVNWSSSLRAKRIPSPRVRFYFVIGGLDPAIHPASMMLKRGGSRGTSRGMRGA